METWFLIGGITLYILWVLFIIWLCFIRLTRPQEIAVLTGLNTLRLCTSLELSHHLERTYPGGRYIGIPFYLYTALNRFVSRKWVAEVEDGSKRTYYKLTNDGKTRLKALLAPLEEAVAKN